MAEIFNFDSANGNSTSSNIVVQAGNNVRVRFSAKGSRWYAALLIDRNGFLSRERLESVNNILEVAEGDSVAVEIRFQHGAQGIVSGIIEEVAK